AERFIPDPFSQSPGARLYQSGDRARYLPNGEIEFLGRRDTQIKVRGFRIEPGEIEAALATHPCVRQSAVLARADGAGEESLVAYLVLEAGGEGKVEEWREYLSQRLPDYLVPTAFIPLAEFPLTPNGKLDREAMIELGLREAMPITDEATPPRTPTAEILAGIWSEVLNLDGGGADAAVFELGGE